MNNRKESRIILLIIVICLIIVIALTYMSNKLRNQEKDYSGLTENELVQVVQDEIDEMNKNALSAKGERDRIEYYVASFLDAIEAEEYEKAYNMLYGEFKERYFSTLSSFEEYAKTKFSKELIVEYTNIERNGDYYVLWATISDPLAGKASSREINFVVQENDLNDFVMSFSVI